MKMQLVAFGILEIEGTRYEHDVVIDRGSIRKRDKAPSKALRGGYGHTPLTPQESLPWKGKTLYVGTGAHGALPVVPELYQQAAERGVEVVVCPTAELSRIFRDLRPKDINAVVHVTC